MNGRMIVCFWSCDGVDLGTSLDFLRYPGKTTFCDSDL